MERIAYNSLSLRCFFDLYTGSFSRLKQVDADGSLSVSFAADEAPMPKKADSVPTTVGGPMPADDAADVAGSLSTERTVNAGLSDLNPDNGGFEHDVT